MKRIDWIDSARGVGIVLVVIGHAIGGLINSPLGKGQFDLRLAFLAIYTFHMPLFLMLSGLLVGQRLERGVAPFLRGLIPTVVWPYFLWSAVQFTAIHALGSLVNNPAGNYWTTILSLPWNTVSQFWFLYALFWLHVLAALIVPRAGPGALLLLALAAKGLALSLVLPIAMKLVCNHLLFYAIGVWLSHDGLARVVVDRAALIRAFVLPVLAGLAVGGVVSAVVQDGGASFGAAPSPMIANLAWRPAALAAAVGGSLATIGLASLPLFAGRPALRRLGQLTMPIFVLHVLFIAGTRIFAVRYAGIESPWLLLPLLVAVGLIGPLVAERLLRPLGWQRYLGF